MTEIQSIQSVDSPLETTGASGSATEQDCSNMKQPCSCDCVLALGCVVETCGERPGRQYKRDVGRGHKTPHCLNHSKHSSS